MDSILTSIKKLLGITEEYTHFDTDITMNINAVLAILTQMGVGPSSGFAILDKTSTWGRLRRNRLQFLTLAILCASKSKTNV